MGSVHRLARLAIAAAGAAFAAAPAVAGDIVINQQGNPSGNTKASVPPQAGDYAGSSWEILDWTLEGVTYRIEGVPQPQTLPAAQVRAVYFDPDTVPPALAKGRALSDRGDYPGARDAFAGVQKDSEALPWAKSEAAFRSADSYVDEGNAAEAEKALAGFKSSFPKSHWVTTATSRRASALMALERIDDAKTEYASLKKLPGVPEDVAAESDYYLVWIDEQVAARRSDAAALQKVIRAYEDLIQKYSGKSQYDTLARRCQVGRASCLIQTGKADEAKDVLEKMAKEAKEPRVLAAIYNKLGTATWHSAKTDKAQMRQALFHYLRVVTLYGDAPGAEDDCAEAMFHAGELFKELREPGNDWAARARREWNDVVARFPGTDWARKAKEAIVSR